MASRRATLRETVSTITTHTWPEVRLVEEWLIVLLKPSRQTELGAVETDVRVLMEINARKETTIKRLICRVCSTLFCNARKSHFDNVFKKADSLFFDMSQIDEEIRKYFYCKALFLLHLDVVL